MFLPLFLNRRGFVQPVGLCAACRRQPHLSAGMVAVIFRLLLLLRIRYELVLNWTRQQIRQTLKDLLQEIMLQV